MGPRALGIMAPDRMASSTRRRKRRRRMNERRMIAHETNSSRNSVARKVKLPGGADMSASAHLRRLRKNSIETGRAYRYKEEEVPFPPVFVGVLVAWAGSFVKKLGKELVAVWVNDGGDVDMMATSGEGREREGGH